MTDPKAPAFPVEPDFDSEEIEFTRCSGCDGHDACEDFGCAIEAGLEHLIEKDITKDFD